jgi:hypothetical protein
MRTIWTVMVGLMLGGAAQAAPSLAPGFSPNPRVFEGLTGDTRTDVAELGARDPRANCSTYVAAPLVLQVERPLGSTRFTIDATGGLDIFIRFSDQTFTCKSNIAIGPLSVAVHDVPAGRLEIYAGYHSRNKRITYNVKIEDVAATKASAEAKAASEAKASADDAAFCQGAKDPLTPKSDLRQAALRAALCGRPGERSLAAAWRGMDDGDDSPLFPAVAVMSCIRLSGYDNWRICAWDAGHVEEAALSAALAEALPDAGRRERFLAAYRAGTAKIEEVRAEMTEHEHGYPKDKEHFDHVLSEVQADAVAMRPFMGALHDLESLVLAVKKGPGFAAGCAEKWTPMLQAYLDKATLPLPDAFRTAPGVLLTEATSFCLGMVGDQEGSRDLHDLIGHGEVFEGEHAALATRLGRGVVGELKTRTLPPWRQVMRDAFAPGAPVASVKVSGDTAHLTFKHVSHKDVEYYGCKQGKITGFNTSGDHVQVEREEHCKSRPITVDETEPPVDVPAADAAKVSPGTTVHLRRGGRDRRDPHGRVLWVHRGGQLIWIFGFHAK